MVLLLSGHAFSASTIACRSPRAVRVERHGERPQTFRRLDHLARHRVTRHRRRRGAPPDRAHVAEDFLPAGIEGEKSVSLLREPRFDPSMLSHRRLLFAAVSRASTRPFLTFAVVNVLSIIRSVGVSPPSASAEAAAMPATAATPGASATAAPLRGAPWSR
jgi:hypothetical protein